MTETERIFKPELLPRKGEYTAWTLAIASVVGLAFLAYAGTVVFWAVFFVILLVFSAFAISLGNWMDRRSQISLRADGISFTNGLRKVDFAWDDVQQVVTFPARWGRTVQVMGDTAHFEFNTLGEVEYQGKTQGRTGFDQGGVVMNEIVKACGLTVETVDGSRKIYTRP